MTPDQQAEWEKHLGEHIKYVKKLHEWLHPTGIAAQDDSGSQPPPPPNPPPPTHN